MAGGYVLGMTGVVLAGGGSRRMGRDKAWLEVEGVPLAERQVRLLSGIFPKVVVSAREPEKFQERGFETIVDRFAARAPIVGIATVLGAVRGPIFALAVDLPKVPGPLIRAIAEALLSGEEQCVVPRAGGRLQPLCAAYRESALASAERRIAAGSLALHDWIGELEAEIWEEPLWRRHAGAEAFVNLNTGEEFETLNMR